MKTPGSVLGGGLTAAVIAALMPQYLSAAASCGSLSSLTLSDTTITMAQDVPAGGFSRPATGPSAAEQAFSNPVAFCRVAATLKPSADSDIKAEVWLPATGWNGQFQAVGNGGWAGRLSYPAMSQALENGYAASSTDTGHADDSAAFALGHPEKLIDYAYRSEHEMTVKAKAIIAAFYGSDPKRSYWNGCSTGGRQAIMEASRFPADFDGIVAGAAANPKTHLDAWRIWIAQAMFKDQASAIPPSMFPMIHQAVLGACDALDGLKDGLIDDPTRCQFDPNTIECKGADASSCLTPAQVQTAKVIMSPVRDRRTGAEISPGFEAGTELAWAAMLRGPEPLEIALDQFKYIIFGKPNWDWRTFDLERDVALADKTAHGTLSSISPDLSAFAGRGGKLLMYHGWSDPGVPPRASVNYYANVLAATAAPSDNASALCVPPGCALHRDRKFGRRRNLCVQDALTAPPIGRRQI
jgi:feruloyl esterase